MAKTRIVFHIGAFRALRTHPNVQRDIEARARRVAAASGSGYEVETSSPPRNRSRSVVLAVSRKARADNARHNTLLRNLGAGR